MSFGALRVSHVAIQAFRGFRDPIAFDLSAPVTVVYAANGTGKTSLCHAIEWLVTGVVQGLPTADLRCKQATKLETSVVGDIAVGDLSIPGVKKGLDSWSIGTEHRQNRILEILAPQVLEDSGLHHAVTIASRREWLRGTHFLFTDSLSALVDATDETKVARRKIFADILGVRHLEETIEDIDRYIDRIKVAQSETLRTLSTAQRDQAQVKAQLDALARQPANLGVLTVDTLLAEILVIVGGKPFAGGSEDNRVQEAEARISAEDSATNIVLSRCTDIASRLQIRNDALKQIATDQISSDQLNAEIAALDKKIVELEASTIRIAGVRTLMQKEIADATRLLARSHELFVPAPLEVSGSSALAGMKASLSAEFTLAPLARSQIRQELGRLQRQFVQLRPAYENLRLLRSDLQPLLASSNPQLQQTERQRLNALQSQRQGLEAQYTAIAEPLRQLQDAATAYAEHLGEGHTCPVCAHDWGTSAALMRALQQTMRGAPLIVSQLESRLKDNNDAIQASLASLSSATLTQTNINRIQTQIASIETTTTRFETELAAVLRTTPGPDPLASLTTAIERYSAVDWIVSLEQLVAEVVTLCGRTLGSNRRPLLALRESLETSLRDFTANRTQSEAQQAAAANDAKALLDAARADHEKANLNRRAFEERLRVNRAAEIEFNDTWRSLAGDGVALSLTAFDRIRRAVSKRRRDLDNAKSKAASARSLASSNALAKRQLELQNSQVGMNARAASVAALLESAQSLRARLDAHSRTLAWQKLSALMPIAQTLFSRMHANRVLDRIHPSSQASPLEWLADAGSIQVSPQNVFSHGQRQDLALSLFLAKGCLQGGTFILDEPVSHLDDLNRVAVLDLFRVLALTLSGSINLVITTSSRNLMRHLREKFALVDRNEDAEKPHLRIYQLEGNPRIGVTQTIAS